MECAELVPKKNRVHPAFPQLHHKVPKLCLAELGLSWRHIWNSYAEPVKVSSYLDLHVLAQDFEEGLGVRRIF